MRTHDERNRLREQYGVIVRPTIVGFVASFNNDGTLVARHDRTSDDAVDYVLTALVANAHPIHSETSK